MAEEIHMADRSPYHEPREILGRRLNASAPSGAPRWVKAFGFIVLALILLVVVMMLAGGGGHGPARHVPTGNAGDQTPPAAIGGQRL